MLLAQGCESQLNDKLLTFYAGVIHEKSFVPVSDI